MFTRVGVFFVNWPGHSNNSYTCHPHNPTMKTRGARDQEWDDTCQVITDAFSSGKPVWPELEQRGGDIVGEIDHQPKGDSVWHLDISRIMPRPHRSVLDYARVARPRPGEPWRRIVADAPRPAQALQGGPQDARSCYTIMTGAPRHWSMWHQVSRNDMAGNPQKTWRATCSPPYVTG